MYNGLGIPRHKSLDIMKLDISSLASLVSDADTLLGAVVKSGLYPVEFITSEFEKTVDITERGVWPEGEQ